MTLEAGANDVRSLAPGVYYVVPGPNGGRNGKIVKAGKE